MMLVTNIGFQEIYSKYPNMVVPDYQRAYTWGKEKVEDLRGII